MKCIFSWKQVTGAIRPHEKARSPGLDTGKVRVLLMAQTLFQNIKYNYPIQSYLEVCIKCSYGIFDSDAIGAEVERCIK